MPGGAPGRPRTFSGGTGDPRGGLGRKIIDLTFAWQCVWVLPGVLLRVFGGSSRPMGEASDAPRELLGGPGEVLGDPRGALGVSWSSLGGSSERPSAIVKSLKNSWFLHHFQLPERPKGIKSCLRDALVGVIIAGRGTSADFFRFRRTSKSAGGGLGNSPVSGAALGGARRGPNEFYGSAGKKNPGFSMILRLCSDVPESAREVPKTP